MRPRLTASAWPLAVQAAFAAVLLGIGTPAGLAQSTGEDTWNPFQLPDKQPPRRKQLPVDQADLQRKQNPKGRSGPVESSDLPPVMAPDTSGLPLDLWAGLDIAELERQLAALDLPPRSPALHQLWRRMMLASASPPGGASADDRFLGLRLEALYRSGLLAEMGEAADKSGASSPLAKMYLARKEIGAGDREASCRNARALAGAGLPGRLKGEALLLIGYCAAAGGDAAGAGLTASMAREEGLTADLALGVLDGVASGAKVRQPLPARVSLLDFRFLQLTGLAADMHVLGRAEPALIVSLAGAGGDMRLHMAAAEVALRLNALPPEAVASIYRRQGETAQRAATGQEKAADSVLRRAHMFAAIEAAPNFDLKTRLLRAFLDDARRAGVYMQSARMLAPAFAGLWPSPSTGILAEPAVEVALAAGDYEAARRWAETAASLGHWLALIDVADPTAGGRPGRGLAHMDELARRGRLSADIVHRLATVLDALDIDVPRAIWEAAGRMPQPAAGYLPETGVLAELSRAAQRKEAGRTVLAAMRAFGANDADGVNILVLGDGVRGLKRAGLEADARRLALEALLGLWPRLQGR